MMAELFDEERLREEDTEAAKEEARAEGRAEGILSLLIGMVKDGILTAAEAAKRANMSVEEFVRKSGLTV